MIEGGVPKRLRTEVIVMAGFLVATLLSLGFVSYALSHVTPESVAAHHQTGSYPDNIPDWNDPQPIEVRPRVPIAEQGFSPQSYSNTVPSDVQLKWDVKVGEKSGKAASDAAGEQTNRKGPPRSETDAADTHRQKLNSLMRALHHANLAKVEPADKAPARPRVDNRRPRGGPSDVNISIIIPLRTALFPNPTIASLVAAFVVTGDHSIKPLPIDAPHGGINVVEVLLVTSRDHRRFVTEEAEKFDHRQAFVRIVPYVPQGARPELKAACLASMFNAGTRAADPRSTHVLMLAPNVDIEKNDGVRGFISSLVASLRVVETDTRGKLLHEGSPTLLASCTMAEPAPEPLVVEARPASAITDQERAMEEALVNRNYATVARAAKNPYRIVHRGFMFTTTAPDEGMDKFSNVSIHAVRNLRGYTTRDGRAHELASSVDAVALDCALISRETLTLFKGLPTAGQTVVDYAMLNQSDMAFDRNVRRYKHRTETIKQLFGAVNIQDAASLPERAKKLMSATLEAMMTHEEVCNTLLDAIPGARDAPVSQQELDFSAMFMPSLQQHGLTAALLESTHDYLEDAWKSLMAAQDVAGEEERGFEFSLALQNYGYSVVASNATGIVNTSDAFRWLPTTAADFGIARYFSYTSYLLSQRLTAKYFSLVRHQRNLLIARPAIRDDPIKVANVTLRVLWDFFCCRCCGFSNEVQELLAALQPYVDANTAAAPYCYCDGPPIAVDDTLNRGHLNQRRTMTLPKDEKIVFVVHRQPSQYDEAIATHFAQAYSGYNTREPDYVVGRSMYEFDQIHARWANATRRIDEVWVPADWVRDVFVQSGVRPSKVHVVPEAIDVNLWDPVIHRTIEWPPNTVAKDRVVCNRPKPVGGRGGANRRPPFVFFSDFKLEPRKGWDVLFEAYNTAFDAKDPVSLYVLTNLFLINVPRDVVDPHNRTVFIEVFNAVVAGVFNKSDALAEEFSSPDWPHFCIILDSVQEADLIEMYNSMDAFVLPTRGEGWGLPLVQAMAMGKAVIATPYGGQSQFMTNANSYPINYTLSELPSYTPYSALDAAPGQRWAHPSVDHTAALMSRVVHNSGERRKAGQQARRDIVANYSYDAVASIVIRQLQRIRRNLELNVSLREPAAPPLPPDPLRAAELRVEAREEADRKRILDYNDAHPNDRKPFKRAAPLPYEQYRRCVLSITLAHLSTVAQRRNQTLPLATIELLRPAEDREKDREVMKELLREKLLPSSGAYERIRNMIASRKLAVPIPKRQDTADHHLPLHAAENEKQQQQPEDEKPTSSSDLGEARRRLHEELILKRRGARQQHHQHHQQQQQQDQQQQPGDEPASRKGVRRPPLEELKRRARARGAEHKRLDAL
jgi:glycosyltransferase involved in cell wall biosynthesis